MEYNKLPLTTRQLIDLLKSRGLIISNIEVAEKQLDTLGYYRLANYLRPMELDKICHTYKANSTFENAVALCEFDYALRTLIFEAIGRIEIALRARMTRIFSLKYGPFWFAETSLNTNVDVFHKNLSIIENELKRSKEEFIKEHYSKYSSPDLPPAWKTIELVSIGTLSKMYSNFSDIQLKKVVAREFNIPQHKIFESWIGSLATLRNHCAHHSRIWNKSFPVTPNIPKQLSDNWVDDCSFPFNKLYAQLCVVIYLLNSVVPQNDFAKRLQELLKTYPNVDVKAMGFPKNWKEEQLWQISTSECKLKTTFKKIRENLQRNDLKL